MTNRIPSQVAQAIETVASIVRGRSSINVRRDDAARVASACRRALADFGSGYGIESSGGYAFDIEVDGKRYTFRRWPNGCGSFWLN